MANNNIGNNRFLKIVLSFVAAFLVCVSSQAFIVVLDAGHGGKDPGALGTYSKEKNINLNVVLKLGKLITENCKGVEVRYTRKTDIFVELDERANIANKANADLFISVHTNSTEGKGAVGSETYSLSLARAAQNLDVVKRENSVIKYESNLQKYNDLSSVENSIINEFRMQNNMRQGAILAQMVQNEYTKIGRHDRGNRQAGFLVLRKTTMPSILTELGYISTPSEEAYLNSEEGINQLANSIFQAFKMYVSPVLRESYAQDVASSAPQFEVPVEETEVAAPAPATQQPQQKPQAPAQQKPQPQQKPQAPAQQKPQAPAQQKPQAQPQSKPAAAKTEPNASGKVYEFRVQFMISDKQLRQDNEKFKGLKDIKNYEVTVAPNRRQFVYTTGSFTSYQQAREWQQKVVQKNPGCFVVVFKDGKRITGDEEAQAKRVQK